MGALDAALGNVARTLIGQFGRAATLVVPGAGGGYDTATGNIESAGADTEISCSVVFDESNISRLFDASIVQQGDRVGIVSRVALGTTVPVAGKHRLVEGANTWQVIAVRSYSSGSQEAAFALLLRR